MAAARKMHRTTKGQDEGGSCSGGNNDVAFGNLSSSVMGFILVTFLGVSSSVASVVAVVVLDTWAELLGEYTAVVLLVLVEFMPFPSVGLAAETGLEDDEDVDVDDSSGLGSFFNVARACAEIP